MSNQSTLLFRRLSQWYLLALTAIGIVLLISHGLINSHLDKQLNDSRVVNVAGRQRMLSQKISKEVLNLSLQSENANSTTFIRLKRGLKATVALWKSSHEGLKNGNSKLGLPGNNSQEIMDMFADIEPHFDSMYQACLSLSDFNKPSSNNLDKATRLLLKHEPLFLEKMDQIVFKYDEEAKNKVIQLRRIEDMLLIFALATLIIELLFIFRPMANYVKKIVQDLIKAEEIAQEQTEEMTVLYKEKEQSVVELRALNYALDQASLFASTTLDGNIIYISKKLKDFLGYKGEEFMGSFSEILSTKEGEQQYIASVLRTPRSNIWTGEWSITTRDGKAAWLESSIVPVNRAGVQQDFLIICNDITGRKETEEKLKAITEDRIQEEVRIQRARSLQVIKAQEKERKRIARDIHDGIGQMLTALKFNLEALNIEKHSQEKTSENIQNLKFLTSKLIKGVRMATFNLTPPELSDYGIATALSRLAGELKKLSAQEILFENKTHFEGRLPQIVETNIYRVIQEAVNNAIKYAEAPFILITLAHSENMLSILVEDHGKGFDMEEMGKKEISEDGSNMGLAFMRERIAYVNGRLFILSAPNEGTRITVNVPLDPTKLAGARSENEG
ncbi:MAG: ATP-binding protein [Bacteroidota bacterium]